MAILDTALIKRSGAGGFTNVGSFASLASLLDAYPIPQDRLFAGVGFDGTAANQSIYTSDGGTWTQLAGGGGSSAWGSITGTLSAQTDLQNALNDKQDQTASQSDSSTGTINALAVTGAFMRLTGAAPDLRGIVPPYSSKSTEVKIYCVNATTVRNQAGTASAANRLQTTTGADVTVPAGGTIVFAYDTVSSLWRQVSTVSWGTILGTLANQSDLNTALAGKQALDGDLTALAALAGTGIAVRTGTDTWAQRSITQPAAGITVTNASGSTGNPTLALANDLAAVEGLATTGLVKRTGTDTWSAGSISATSGDVTMSTARILGRTTAATGAIEEISVGAGLSLSAGVLSATGGAGFEEIRIDDYQGPAIIGQLGRYHSSRTGTLVNVRLVADSLPVGSNVIAELRKNSTTSGNVLSATLQITTTEALTNGQYVGTVVSTFTSSAIAANDVFYLVLTSVGSTTPATNVRAIIYLT